ncbi:hypothetical protein IPL85_05675 [Candidatus Saccharibacteria bacterium]|nr:MAG: hypothetical protein IPL85_05675 [Candidatus Saccharibacteria bacterium]
MQRHRVFIRSSASRGLFDLFLVSAVTSILLLRFYLHVTGYPIVGGTKYHIAHVLWGGVIMLIAFMLNIAFLGRAIQRVVAFTAGVGFGVFIDEIGKLITRDNDYFYRPAVGIIYAIFVALYLTISFLTRTRKLTSEEYQLSALRQLEEAVHQDMDIRERAATRKLLEQADQQAILTIKLTQLLRALPVSPTHKQGFYTRQRRRFTRAYARLWKRRSSSILVRWFFVLETLAFVFAIVGAMYANLSDVRDFFAGKADYGHSLVIGQLVTTLVSAACIVVGLVWLGRSRLRAFEWFRRATLINLLLTQFFEFSRVEFGALPGFMFNLLLLAVINMAIAEEIRHQDTAEKNKLATVAITQV